MKNLDPALIRRANDVSLSGSAGDAISREMEITFKHFSAAFPDTESLEDAQREYLSSRLTQWEDLVYSVFSDLLSRRARFVSWAVAGPANYNHARARKQLEADDHAREDGNRKLNAFIENTRDALSRIESPERQVERYRCGADAPIAADDPLALEKLSARLEFLTAEREQMTRVNRFYRTHGTALGCEGISAAQAQTIEADMQRRAQAVGCADVPYPPYLLQNLSANIRRIRERTDTLIRLKGSREIQNSDSPQTKNIRADVASSSPEESSSTPEPFRIVEDKGAMRLQILFDGKPSEQARALLKANGFRWSPSRGAWQRQLTDNARRTLSHIHLQLAQLVTNGDSSMNLN